MASKSNFTDEQNKHRELDIRTEVGERVRERLRELLQREVERARENEREPRRRGYEKDLPKVRARQSKLV